MIERMIGWKTSLDTNLVQRWLTEIGILDQLDVKELKMAQNSAAPSFIPC